MIINESFSPEDRKELHIINNMSFSGSELPRPEQFDAMLDRSRVYVAKTDSDGRILGFAIVSEFQSTSESYLWVIATRPEFRGTGVAAYLLNRAVIFAMAVRKHKSMYLNCRPTNPAQKLYFDNGFYVEGVDKDYYETGGHALRMRKVL